MNNTDTNVFDIKTFSQANPAAASDFIFAVPARRRLQILSISFILANDANAANRNVGLIFDDSALVFDRCGLTPNFTANETITFQFYKGAGTEIIEAGGGRIWAPLNGELYLVTGDSIRSQVTNMQVGDQISDIVIRAKVWIEAGV